MWLRTLKQEWCSGLSRWPWNECFECLCGRQDMSWMRSSLSLAETEDVVVVTDVGYVWLGWWGETVHNVQDKETLSSEASKRSMPLPVPLTSRTVSVCVSSPCLFLLPPLLSSIFPFPPLSLFLTVLIMQPRTLCILGKCFSVGFSPQPPPAQCLWFQVPKFDVICYPSSRYFCTFGCICIYL